MSQDKDDDESGLAPGEEEDVVLRQKDRKYVTFSDSLDYKYSAVRAR